MVSFDLTNQLKLPFQCCAADFDSPLQLLPEKQIFSVFVVVVLSLFSFFVVFVAFIIIAFFSLYRT